MRQFHARLNRWLWGRASLLAVAIVVGWITGSFYTGLTVALILFVAVFVGSGLFAGSMEWRVGRRFGAPRSRVRTTREVMKGAPLLLVTHEADPAGSWHFVNEEDDLLRTELISVHIQQMLEHDPSVAALASLPPGWRASRSSEDDDWVAAPTQERAVKGR